MIQSKLKDIFLKIFIFIGYFSSNKYRKIYTTLKLQMINSITCYMNMLFVYFYNYNLIVNLIKIYRLYKKIFKILQKYS